MDGVTAEKLTLTFNGPLEAGVRAVAVLGAAFPRSFDIQRLTALDYLLVRTEQLGGPDDLHPSAPIKTPATEVRRKLVQQSLMLMMARDLVVREVHAHGICYSAGETASFFLNSLQTPYMTALKERASWLVAFLANYTDAESDALMRKFFDNWVMEFHAIENSLGVE
ncbi:MAG: threonine transporter [Pirellulaceae bacterium]|nr:threonine transporter [Pirellulaceae bacterium]